MTFPLYQDLLKNTSEKELSEPEKDDLIKKIKKVDEFGHELIYALIRSYQLEHEITYDLPYESKMLKLGLKFDLEKLPNRLKNIIVLFVDKHLQKMKEDSGDLTKVEKNKIKK